MKLLHYTLQWLQVKTSQLTLVTQTQVAATFYPALDATAVENTVCLACWSSIWTWYKYSDSINSFASAYSSSLIEIIISCVLSQIHKHHVRLLSLRSYFSLFTFKFSKEIWDQKTIFQLYCQFKNEILISCVLAQLQDSLTPNSKTGRVFWRTFYREIPGYFQRYQWCF